MDRWVTEGVVLTSRDTVWSARSGNTISSTNSATATEFNVSHTLAR